MKPPRHPSVVLGFDYGERRMGVAVGQMVTRTATPLTTLQHGSGGPDWNGIAALVQDWTPSALVVGRPDWAHGGARTIRAAIADFRQQLETRFSLPVYAVNEAYSSLDAYQRLKVQRRTHERAQRIHKGEIDRVAAAILLEAWMSDEAHEPCASK
jgi:putative Holliday junction resolvase